MKVIPFLVCLFACGGSSSGGSETPTSEAPREVDPAEVVVTEVAEGLRVHSFVSPEEAAGVSSHVVETSGHLVVVDTQLMIPHSEQMRAYCDALGKPIDRVIVSHGHPDHYFGVNQFADQQTYALASTLQHIARRRLGHIGIHQREDGPLSPTSVTMPANLLEQGAFEVDGVRFEVREVLAAEDVTQALITLPEHEVLIAQDLVSHRYHAFTGTGPVRPWIDTLRSLPPARHVMAGHGPPGGATVVPAMIAYLEVAEDVKRDATTRQGLIDEMDRRLPELGGRFLLEVTALIVFRDRARANP